MTQSVDQAILKAKSLAKKGHMSEAAQVYRDVLAKFPGNTRALEGLAALAPRRQAPNVSANAAAPPAERFNAILALYQQRRFNEAAREAEALAARHPRHLALYGIMGASYAGLGEHEKAANACRKALEIEPGFAEMHSNLGNALKDLSRFDEAIAAYVRALELKPALAETHNNLGIVLKHRRRFGEAIEAYTRAIQLKPGYAEAHHHLGVALIEAGRYDEAVAAFSQALALKPDFAEARAQKLHLLARMCDWTALATETPVLATLGTTGEEVAPFSLLALEDDPKRHLARARRYAQKTFRQIALSAPARPATRPDRLRIGYFSADFRDHVIARLIAGVLELHDPRGFDVHCYSYGPASADPIAERIKAAAHHFHDVRAMSEEGIARQARADGIDVAIDLTGYTLSSRSGIFAFRAAPVQISYLGYPGSMGAPFIDYMIADHFIIPPQQQAHYAEKIIFLPHNYLPCDPKREMSSLVPARAQENLPRDGFVFCCHNASYKLTPAEFDIWMRLLGKVEGSVLWLLSSNRWAQENLRAQAARRGIDGTRLIFAADVAYADYVRRFELADLFLDTFTYNANATASDALWAGLPVLTLPGEGLIARAAGSLLSALAMPELIAATREDYEARALRLAGDPTALAAIRQKLASERANAPLFDAARFVRHLEDGYRLAYERWFSGHPPDAIDVPGR